MLVLKSETPLYTQLIEKKIIENKPIKDDWFITIQTQVDKMTNIISEFLTIKEIKKRKLKYKWEICDIHKLLLQVVKNYKVTNPDRKIDLFFGSKEKEVQVWADEEKLQGVFVNIINNAIKFSPPESLISISTESNSGKVLINVIDQGKGIGKKDMPYIFEPFFRGGKIKREGSGMGLYFCKNIVWAHGGSIEVNSRLNHGTNVIIKLPLFNERKK